MGDLDEWGTLEPGKEATILIVDGNPAERIGDSRNIETVIQAGRVLDRSTLEFDENLDPGYRPGTPVGN